MAIRIKANCDIRSGFIYPKVLQHFIEKCIFLSLFSFFLLGSVSAQKFGKKISLSDSSLVVPNTDSLTNQLISGSTDSILSTADSTGTSVITPATKEPKLKSKVTYDARDSIRFEVEKKKIYLYGDANIAYENTTIKAGYIEIDWVTNEITALPITDSLGKETELPVVTDNGQVYNCHAITFNFNSKKGRIKQVITDQADGKLHGEIVKKIDENCMFVKNGKFSTCINPEPHFHIQANKLKVIKNDKIVSGPAYFAFENVPSPLAVPFGFFPNSKKQKSGIVLPQPGQSVAQGFFIRNAGYFFGISDRFVMQLSGDIYSRGSFGVRLGSMYKVKYKYSGNLELSHNSFITSSRELPDYAVTRNYFVKWRHMQDVKSNPNSSFSAEINAGTNTNFTQNVSAVNNVQNFLNNRFLSNISFSKSFAGTPFNLVLNASHDQNTSNRVINVTLPQLQLNMMRIFPFTRKNPIGAKRWYENVGLNYNLNARNSYSSVDSLFFNRNQLRKLSYGVQHSASMSTNFKLLKYFTLTPSVNANSRFDFKTVTKKYQLKTDEEGQITGEELVTDTINAFRPNVDVTTAMNLSTVVYGMFRFKGNLEAIRHTMTPTLGFSYRPEINQRDTAYSLLGNQPVVYSRHEISPFGQPPVGKQGALNFSLMNNLEMKVKPAADDTTGKSRKIKLIDQFGFTGNYNFLAEKNKLSDIAFRAVTSVFKNKISLNYSMNWSPYQVNSNGTITEIYYLKSNNRLLRFRDATLAANINLNHQKSDKPKRQSQFGTQDQVNYINANPAEFIDFNIPWNISAGYNLRYSKNYKAVLTELEAKAQVIQAITFAGDFSLTANWKIQVSSGYDVASKRFSTTSVNIYRDMHCWEVRFNWVPFGQQQSFMFTLQPKAALLQDLKISRTRSWFDN